MKVPAWVMGFAVQLPLLGFLWMTKLLAVMWVLQTGLLMLMLLTVLWVLQSGLLLWTA